MRMQIARVWAGALAAVFLAGAAAAEELQPHQKHALQMLSELVETDTTHSTGDTTRAAKFLASQLRRAGFSRRDVRVLEEVPRKGNLVARLRAKAPTQEPILLLAHLDVVEADAADWSVPPFQFTEADGYYYGRGVLDDKDEAAIHIANLIRLKQEGAVLSRDIVVALTADEEGGTHNGVVWLLKEHRALIDAAFAINEGGGGALRKGQRLFNAVQASEKIYQSFELEVTDPGGHSSVPRPGNAIYHLADALLRVRELTFPVGLNPVTRAFFERSAAQQPESVARAMRGVLRKPPARGAARALAKEAALYNALLRTTCVATQLNAGHAPNALPQRARATVNCRILPTETPDSVEQALRRAIADSRVSIKRLTGVHSQPSPPSPLTPEVLGAIEATTDELWPGVPVIPIMSTGATDGLFLRAAGIPVYGVSGIFNELGDVRAHGKDERILARSFFEGQEFLYRLLKRLAAPAPAPTP